MTVSTVHFAERVAFSFIDQFSDILSFQNVWLGLEILTFGWCCLLPKFKCLYFGPDILLSWLIVLKTSYLSIKPLCRLL